MTGPSTSTIKKLFSVSHNLCAFPKCPNTLVDETSGKVTGRICHIKASSVGGPRYDASQTPEERHGFDNLILMCPIHHDVIDADIDSYSIERLKKMKLDHIKKTSELKAISDQMSQEFINNINSNILNNGSLIVNQNQLGGQVAHSINNFGIQPRQISQASANIIIKELKKFPPESYGIFCLMNNSESYQLAIAIDQILRLAGWKASDEGIVQMIFNSPIKNINLEIPDQKSSLDLLLNWLIKTDLKPQGIIIPVLNRVEIIVGENV